MGKEYETCAAKMKEVSSLAQILGVIGWDQETMMPENAAEARSEQSSLLAGILHDKLVDQAFGETLKNLSAKSSTLSNDEQVCVREWLRDYEKSVKVPSALVREITRTSSLAQTTWVKAREDSDFSSFAPWLEKIIELKRQYAECLGYKNNPYDALLDDYEPKMTVAELDPIMEAVRKGIVPIVAAIKDSTAKNDVKILKKRYPEEKQETLARYVMSIMGVDQKGSRLDRSAHPFCCGICPTDVRITTRYDEHWLPQALYGVIHESGHALYEQGLKNKPYTPLSEAVSVGVHESQSRIWENMICRSQAFVSFLFPYLKKLFPQQLKGTTVKTFYRAINQVTPSTIRVEADEVTYSLHILLRYELEKALITSEIQVKDLPKIWNEKMKQYLGIVPTNDADGVLQDIHWAHGTFGYFPTYLLGNLYAAQCLNKIADVIPKLDKKIASGNFAPILTWLRENIHRHGRRYSPSELIKKATGKNPDANYFLKYLQKKFGEIYSPLTLPSPSRGEG